MRIWRACNTSTEYRKEVRRLDKRRPRVRDSVIYHDSKGSPHNALLTCVFDQDIYGPDDLTSLPCVNLVYVTEDRARDDSYGRQIVRETSQVHKTSMPTHGHYWRFEWEEPNPYVVPSEK